MHVNFNLSLNSGSALNITLILYNHVNLHVSLTRTSSDRCLQTFQRATLFWKSGSTVQKRTWK